MDEQEAAGPPSEVTVRRVAEKFEKQFMNLGGELMGQPFERGRELVSRGEGQIPGGTLIYPIRFEEFAVTFYVSQDSFGGWQFSTGEKNNSAGRIGLVQFKDRIVDLRFSSDLIIALGQPGKPVKAQTEEAKKKREVSEKAEAKLHQERMANSARWQAEEAEKARKKAEELKQDEPAPASQRRERESTVKPPETQPAPEVQVSSSSDKTVPRAQAKAELAALEVKINTERQRYQQATDTINRLTNFKKVPVKEGTAAYHQCMDASRIIQEVEQKAPGMTAEKARLATLITELEK